MLRWVPIVALLLNLATVARAESPVAAVVETTLGTAAGQIRQFAFDGDPKTYFASAKDAGRADHFTLRFDKPVAVTSIAVTTGKPAGGDTLDAGTLAVSADGQTFETVAKFVGGLANAKPAGRKIQAVRLQPSDDLKHPLAIREIAVESDPPVVVFQYPVEIVTNADDAPEMKEWLDKAARVCERQYPLICTELRSADYRPPTVISMTLKSNYNGVAATGGTPITGAVKYFKAHQDDVGAMVHETVHCVQHYRTRNNPGWLVEGVADYVRFFKYEPPGKLGRINPDRAHYNGSYRTTAAFLAYLTQKYDPDVVRKLNQAMREGEYKEELFKTYTKKTVQELDDEWRATLKR